MSVQGFATIDAICRRMYTELRDALAAQDLAAAAGSSQPVSRVNAGRNAVTI